MNDNLEILQVGEKNKQLDKKKFLAPVSYDEIKAKPNKALEDYINGTQMVLNLKNRLSLSGEHLFNLNRNLNLALFNWHKRNPPEHNKSKAAKKGLHKKEHASSEACFEPNRSQKDQIRACFKNKTLDDLFEYFKQCWTERRLPVLRGLDSRPSKSFLKGPGEQRWGTPKELIDRVKLVFPLNGIELDPASETFFNETVVKADRFFSRDDDGLKQDWHANFLFMNPPFSMADQFTAKLLSEIEKGHTRAAIVVVQCSTGDWFERILKSPHYQAYCIINRKVKFVPRDELKDTYKGNPLPICVIALGSINPNTFKEVFEDLGPVFSIDSTARMIGRLNAQGLSVMFDHKTYKQEQFLKKHSKTLSIHDRLADLADFEQEKQVKP